MSIGDFSRATRLSAKTLRFYHQVGLLTPVHVSESSGYRFYSAEQISEAQVIRDFRSMQMPIEVIHNVLSSPTDGDRDRLIGAHLERMEEQLETTRSAVASLRSLLQPATVPIRVERRSLRAVSVVIIRESIDLGDLSSWYSNATKDLDALVSSGDVVPTGPRGGIWDTELFLNERGEAALFLPVGTADLTLTGRACAELLPPVHLAVATHRGTDDTIAEVYGALGAYVTEHALSIDGPIRETYLTKASSTTKEAITEIGWPVTPPVPQQSARVS